MGRPNRDEFVRVELQGLLDRYGYALTQRQREVLQRYFGLNGHEPTSLAQVANTLGCSKERARQMWREAQRILEGQTDVEAIRDKVPSPAVRTRERHWHRRTPWKELQLALESALRDL